MFHIIDLHIYVYIQYYLYNEHYIQKKITNYPVYFLIVYVF